MSGGAKTFIFVIDRDGTGNVSEFDRDENGREIYVGRAFLDWSQTAHIVSAMDAVDALQTNPSQWYADWVSPWVNE